MSAARERPSNFITHSLTSRHLPAHHMVTSSNGNIFRVTGPLCGEFTGYRWIPLTKASDVALWCLLWSASWINGWVNNREAGNLRRHCAHYDVIVMNWWMTSNGHRNTPVLSPINLVCGYFINTRERFNVRKPCHKLMRFGEKYIIANFRDKQINQ